MALSSVNVSNQAVALDTESAVCKARQASALWLVRSGAKDDQRYAIGDVAMCTTSDCFRMLITNNQDTRVIAVVVADFET